MCTYVYVYMLICYIIIYVHICVYYICSLNNIFVDSSLHAHVYYRPWSQVAKKGKAVSFHRGLALECLLSSVPGHASNAAAELGELWRISTIPDQQVWTHSKSWTPCCDVWPSARPCSGAPSEREVRRTTSEVMIMSTRAACKSLPCSGECILWYCWPATGTPM